MKKPTIEELDAALKAEIELAVAQAKNDRDVAYLANLSKIARNGDLDDLTREHRAYKALAKRIGLDDAGKKWRAARLVAGFASPIAEATPR